MREQVQMRRNDLAERVPEDHTTPRLRRPFNRTSPRTLREGAQALHSSFTQIKTDKTEVYQQWRGDLPASVMAMAVQVPPIPTVTTNFFFRHPTLRSPPSPALPASSRTMTLGGWGFLPQACT
ncbi:hypothetical protein CORC01_13744 [Colletotrichum orchidophilum]|uniref:Uncharacterized protein n=1 Tax=Colletotrichum orchidophilum TaxID=1209926 RepID=A0A1G4AP88_9PEZI|nr:uncharacterized protein CORC01_13744 [Colletotrichum orchidophilum]OHE90967.1 hypothetical protein CORC01_13744 [Colletotrichum orchidophilum]